VLLLDPDAELPEPAPYLSPAPTGHEPTLSMLAPTIGQPIAEPSVPHYGFPTTTPGPADGIPWAGPIEPAVVGRDDEFSVMDAYYDLIEILGAPRDFFGVQTGRVGNRAPLSMLVAYTLNIALGLLFMLFTEGAKMGPSGMILVLLSPIAFVLLYSMLTVVALGGAALLHVCCALFRGNNSYSGSLRAFVYAAAPACTAVALALVLSPITARNAPLAALHAVLPYGLAVIGALWSMALLGTALRHIHLLSMRAVLAILILLSMVCGGCGLAVSLLPDIG
jgi:hypothetical protein